MTGGDVTLGCLLGQYDRAQSFDVASKASPVTGDIGSWALQVGSASFLDGPTNVHSSSQTLWLHCGSVGNFLTHVYYEFAQTDDLYARWFPDVTTHAQAVGFWARAEFSQHSGQYFADLGDASGETDFPIPFAASVQHGSVKSTAVKSGGPGGGQFRIYRTAQSSNSGLLIDDVVMQIDPITLHPTFETEHRQQLISEQQRTLGGRLYSTVWDKFFAYTLPLQFLPTSHADLINWWWENNFNLALTLDTSDSESIRICRIVNTQQPIGRRMSPYFDQWQGALLLESIDRGSLVF